MEFKRVLYSHLKEWKTRPNRKPLIIRGGRQVGKTTLIKNFAKKYKYYIFLNLEKSEDIQYFDNYNNIANITDALFLSFNIPISEIKNTLLFIDEIQESPQAIKYLRYFYEEVPDLDVIAAGSLLEFSMRQVKSFPVGRVEYLYLYPLNFPEFLEAIGHNQALAALNKVPLEDYAHQTLINLFNKYTIIGGMPEVVKAYTETESISNLPRYYESIWGTLKNDVEKYTDTESERRIIKHIVACAHLYVNERIKFQNFGDSNFKSREVGEAFRNLDSAGVIKLVYPTSDIIPPVKKNLRKSPRIQFMDTGILNHSLNIQAKLLGLTDLNEAYKGAIIPHIINQEIISLNKITNNIPAFWTREKTQASAEIDLVIPYKDMLIPVEIKSGVAGKLKSLHQFIDRAPHCYAIRIYGGNFNIEKHKTPANKKYLLMNLPYYLGTQIEKYVEMFVDNY